MEEGAGVRPWSTYFRNCATVSGARSRGSSIVKFPREVTTGWTVNRAAAGTAGVAAAVRRRPPPAGESAAMLV